jgi:hypothetical protein
LVIEKAKKWRERVLAVVGHVVARQFAALIAMGIRAK